jgi:hypothetical protein
MMIAESLKQHHERASRTWREFLEFAEQRPEMARPLDVPDIQCRYPVQAWPTFITPRRRIEIAAATIGVFKLLKAIPERLFAMDLNKIAAFYGIPPAIAPLLLSEPNGIDVAVGRGDFIDSGSGFKCVEFNPYGNLGGLETEFISAAYRRGSPFLRFLEKTDAKIRIDRPVLALFEHIIRHTLARGLATDTVNLAALIEDDDDVHYEANTHRYAQVYAEALAGISAELKGQVVCVAPGAVVQRDRRLYAGDLPLHAAWEIGLTERCPAHLFAAFKRGRIAYFNGPFAGYLGDKRNLSLLSQALEGDCFAKHEKAIIRRHVPWSRNVEDVDVEFMGRRRPLGEHVIVHREQLVLKKGLGMKGDQVFMGHAETPARWRQLLDAALNEHDWVVQEFLRPRTYLYQHGEQGVLPYHGVWGTYCYGDTYCGAYLRLMPETYDGPINSAQGAMTGLVFEAE